jgi:hypothetical protein
MILRRIAFAAVWVFGLLMVLFVMMSFPAVAGELRGEGALGAQTEAAEAAALSLPPQTTGGTPAKPSRTAGLPRLPLYFIENRGQMDDQVAYYVQGKDKTTYFTAQGLTFALAAQRLERERKDGGANSEGGELSHEFPRVPSARWIVKLDFVGANPHVQPIGVDETGALISYFKGRPEEWVTGLGTYSKVVYRDLWPGIDLQYIGLVDQLKYQFVVRPGGDPSTIRLAYRGPSQVTLDEARRLQVSTPVGSFQDDAPYAYQQDQSGENAEVAVSYEFLPSSHERYVYGFHVGDYDRSRTLVLDPTVIHYCGYLGGLADDVGWDIAVDGEGNAYVTGHAESDQATFPETVGPDLSYNSSRDAFVAKVRADLTGLDYCGYIGGSSVDGGEGIVVDESGHAYVVGTTASSEATFPVTIGPDLSHNDDNDCFAAKLSVDGTDLLYCGYIGGSGSDFGVAIDVDGSDNAYVAGITASDEETFPVSVGPDLDHGGDYDAYVAKVRADGAGLVYCGYVGGTEADRALGIAVDGLGSAYLAGYTSSSSALGFPATVGPDLTHAGGDDGFVAKVSPDGASLAYCGYVGGSRLDWGRDIAVDGSGRAYVTGRTDSSPAEGFPVTVGPDLSFNGGPDAFVARVSADGTGFDYCGYIGGLDWDLGDAIALDGLGNAYVAGETTSSQASFPVADGPDLTHNGGHDAFVARVQAGGGGLDYCGYVGGSRDDRAYGIAVDGSGNVYITGETESSEAEAFPVKDGPDLTHNGAKDAFVARVGENRRPALGAVTPKSGSSKVGVTVYFTTTWSDADGWQDLKHCYLHIGDSPSLVGNVTLLYNVLKDKLWLLDDKGTAWLGGYAPGSLQVIENSQARLHCAPSAAGGLVDTLAVQWVIEFKPGYTGTKRLGLKAKDMHKARAKAAWKATWTIVP